VRLLIADTGPVNYLILIRHIDLLPRMFERVVIPVVVRTELSSPVAPPLVQRWIATPPVWLEIVETQAVDPVAGLHKGESAAISLAASLHADLLLMDDRKGAKAARSKGFRVTGTLGLLEMAAQRGLLDFAEAAERLRQTTFRGPEALLDLMLKRNSKKNGS
jgi:predicted nucleic acid-binding protein